MADELRALSVARPWPTLILHHGKTVENRMWPTHYRGPLLIHASRTFRTEALTFAAKLGVGRLSWTRSDYPIGIVGVADVLDVCDVSRRDPVAVCGCGPWAARGQFHWQLGNVRPLPLVECGGRLGLWEPPIDVLTAVCAQAPDLANVGKGNRDGI